MNIAIIKKLNEKFPYWLKKPFTKVIRKKLIENKVFLETYAMLEEQEKISQEEKKQKQFNSLKRILIYAYKNTKYYRKVFEDSGFNPECMKSVDEMKKIPVLTKEILKNNYRDLVVDDIKDFYEISTGGTSGEPTYVLMERNAIYKEWAFVYHYWSKFGYDFKSSRLATFRGVDLGKKICEINPLYSEIRMNPFLMNKENINIYVEKIKEYQCDFIYGYPSIVYNFCRLLDRKGLSQEFKAVFLISENLYGFQKELITRVLKCPIAMFYGHSERAVFGEEYDGKYIFNSAYGYTEFKESQNILVTGFINLKMPLVRYLVDDSVVEDGERYLITGHRESEVLYGKDGECISAAAINFHDKTFEGIMAYQFYQDVPGKCILIIVPDKEIVSGQIRKIENRVNNKFGGSLNCRVVVKNQIYTTSRGKYKMIIQNWKK